MLVDVFLLQEARYVFIYSQKEGIDLKMGKSIIT